MLGLRNAESMQLLISGAHLFMQSRFLKRREAPFLNFTKKVHEKTQPRNESNAMGLWSEPGCCSIATPELTPLLQITCSKSWMSSSHCETWPVKDFIAMGENAV